MSVGKVSITFFNRLNLEKTLVRDQKKDTLLYAAQLKLRITDWFFLKDKVELKYIGLEDAVIKQNRIDSVWNYQFIADYFTSPTPKDRSSKPIQLLFKKVDLKNVIFLSDDQWVGTKQTIKVGSMLADIRKIDLVESRFHINEVLLDNFQFLTEEFDGKRPPRVRKKYDPREMYFNAGMMRLQLDRLKISNSSFFNTNLTDGKMNFIERQPSTGFDGRFISFNQINGEVKDFTFINDTIRANLALSTVERSGFTVKEIKAKFRLTPQVMEFSNLLIRTPKSVVSNYYAMHFTDFNEDMREYMDSVKMSARFRSSEVHSDDIAFFAPELKEWNKEFTIKGTFNGTVSNFYLNDVFLKSGNVSYVTGDIRIKGLPDIDKTHFQLDKGTIQTNYNELAVVVPAMRGLKTPDLPSLGVVRYNGSFKGTVKNFAAQGNVATGLGAFSTNISMRFPDQGQPTYKGFISSRQFNLGRFIKEPALGTITFDGAVDGMGFAKATMVTQLAGYVSQLQFNDYNYRNIQVNGTFQKQYFNGELKADDLNFDFTSQLEINLTNEIPHFNILGDLVESDLQALNFTKDKIRFTGLFDLNFSGRNIDEFLGNAKILNAVLVHDSTQISFDSLNLSSFYQNDIKMLTASSNEFDVIVSGKFNIIQLPGSVQSMLNRYYPSFIPPATAAPNQDFDFTLRTRDFTKYASLLDKRIGGFNYAHFTGSVNTNRSEFDLRGTLPFFSFNEYVITNANIDAQGREDSLTIKGTVVNVAVGDSLAFPNTDFTIRSSRDHSLVHLATRSTNTLDDADLNAEIITFDDGASVRLKPSSFVLNNKKWTLEEKGEITIRKSILSANNVRFTSGFQEITVSTHQEEGSNTNDLLVKLDKVNIGDFLPIVLKDPKIEGTATGTVKMSDFFGKFALTADLNTEHLWINDDSIGAVKLAANYPTSNSKIAFKVESPNDGFRFFAEGTYDLKAKADESLNTQVRLDDASIKFLNQFLGSLFSDIHGQAEGLITLKGDINAPTLIGTARLRNASMKVDYTQVYYFIDNAELEFAEDQIEVGSTTVRDRNGNTGTVSGTLYHRGFKNMRYQFDVYSSRMLVLDTRENHNSNFYGKAIGNIRMSLVGPEDNLSMHIEATVNDTTQITIPPTNSRESGEADFIVFKQHGVALTSAANPRTRLIITLELNVNPLAQVNVVLDDLSGDVIKAMGSGKIRMTIDNGRIDMRGRYMIESGLYAFNFQSFIHKPFILLGGSDNYIEWTGDPADAKINLQAQYVAERVSLNELVSNQSLDLGSNIRAYRGEVYVIARLRGMLSSPDIDFKIDFPSSQALTQNANFAQFLNKLESDTSEMVKQVTWLIAFNSFAPYGEIRTGVDVRSISANSISRRVGDVLSKAVTRLLSDLGLEFEVGGSVYSSATFFTNASGNNPLDRTRLNFKFTKNILNGKIIISAGTDVDFYVGNTVAAQSGNWQWLPDLSAQFLLREGEKGKLKAIVFTRSSLDINQTAIGRRNRMGASLSYSRDFGRKKRKQQEAKKQQATSPATVEDKKISPGRK